jgi:hypothetical protein
MYCRGPAAAPRKWPKMLLPDMSFGTGSPTASNTVGPMSSPETNSFETRPGVTCPGHRISIGTFSPESYKDPFPCGSACPLSPAKITSVFLSKPRLASASNTHWNSSSIREISS